MSTRGPIGLGPLLNELCDQLDTLHRSIVCREAETKSVQGVWAQCNTRFLALEEYRRWLLAKRDPTDIDSEMARIFTDVNSELRAVREALAQLIEVLNIRDAAAGRRRVPRDFEKRHGAVEAVIENIIPMISGLAHEIEGIPGMQAHPTRRQGRSGLIDDSSGGREYRQIGRAQRGRRKLG